MVINYVLDGKVLIIHLIFGLINQIYHNIIQCFLTPCRSYKTERKNVKIELDFFYYATKLGTKETTGVDTSKESFVKRVALISPK